MSKIHANVTNSATARVPPETEIWPIKSSVGMKIAWNMRPCPINNSIEIPYWFS
jgi:hypothetical protein